MPEREGDDSADGRSMPIDLPDEHEGASIIEDFAAGFLASFVIVRAVCFAAGFALGWVAAVVRGW